MGHPVKPPMAARDLAVSRVELIDVSKSYGSVQAVRSASLQLEPGKVTAIVGENGAGKSTLVKMLAGVERPDSGGITVNGGKVTFESARDAARAGIGMVFQETALVRQLTVWENIALGWETSTVRGLDKRACLLHLKEIGDKYWMRVPAERKVDDLPVSVQQQVEILKVLYREANVIILDEPTGVLTPQEAQGLFKAVRTLCAAGKSVIFISHKLNEVLEIADLIYVMRAGEIVATTTPGEMEPRDLARLMLGNELPVVERAPAKLGTPPVLSLEGLVCGQSHSAKTIGPIDLEVCGGTVLGVAGVAGSGQDEFIATLTGLKPVFEGSVTLHGATKVTLRPGGTLFRSVRQMREAGLAYVPSDRGQVATLAAKPLWFSAIAGRQREPRFSAGGIIRKEKARELASRIIKEGAVKANSVEDLPSSLSGGNLQKFIVAREFASGPRLLVVEEPTRGIDVGSAVTIRQRIRDFAASGCAVVVASSDLDELMDVCDSIVVFFDGAMVVQMDRSDATTESVGAAMTGLSRKEALL